VIVPVFVALPTVSVLFPVAVIAPLTVTEKVLVFPITVRFPFVSTFTITEALISAVPVTVSVEPLRLQLVPGLVVCPVEEMVKFCAFDIVLNRNNVLNSNLIIFVVFI
jgi:hypothetical protein